MNKIFTQKIKQLILSIVFTLGFFSAPSSSKAGTYYWDTTAGAGNGTGGSGTFTTATNFWSLTAAGDATLVANTGTTNDVANFEGTAGTVGWSNNLIQGAFNINTTEYTFTTASASGRTLSSTNVTLGNNVNLNLSSYSTSTLKFQSNSIIGGTGSSITLVGGSSGKRVVLLDSGATVASSVPIIFNITGTLAAGDYTALGNSSSYGYVNSTIKGNSGTNDMTFYSSATALVLNGAVSGSQRVSLAGNGLSVVGRVELNASNSYAGKTTLNGGTVYVSNNFAFSTNSIVVASNNSTIRGIGVSTNTQIANAVEFGTSGANLIIGGYDNSNSISLTGIISGSGSVSAAAKTGSISYSAYIMNTNNTFNGGVFSSNGYTMYVANLGSKADTNSAIGSGTTITLGNATTSGGIRWLGSAVGNEVSDKDFVLLGTNSILANGATNATLTLNGALDSTVAGNKTITLAGYSTNSLIINGLINEFAGSTNSLTIGTSSSGTVILANTNNSFSGAITITNNTSGQSTVLSVANIGNSGANSALGKNGTINIGGTSASAVTALQYTGTGETSDKVINLSATASGATLDQSGTGNLKFTSAITATGVGAKTITLQGSTAGTGELGGAISDLGGNVISLSKSGTGTWKLSDVNTYTGLTTLSGAQSGGAGTLKIALTNGLVKGVLVGASAIANVGVLDLTAGGDYVMNSFGNSTKPGGNINFTNSSGTDSKLTFTNANNYITMTNNGGKILNNATANLTIVFNGAVDIGSSATNDVTFAGEGNFRANGALTSTGAGLRGLNKSGAGTLTLAGAGSYNGTNIINGGKLVMANPQALPGSSPTVFGGGQLKVDYTGASSTLGNMQLTADSTLDAGTNSTSTLKFASATNWLSTNNILKISSYYPVGANIYILNTNNVPLAQIKKQEDTNAVASLDASGLLTFTAPPSGSTYASVGYAAGTESEIAANGLSNLMNYALGQNGPLASFPATPALSTDSNAMTLTAQARTDDSSLKFYGQWTYDLSANDWELVGHSTELFPPDLSYSQTIDPDPNVLAKFIRFKVLKQ